MSNHLIAEFGLRIADSKSILRASQYDTFNSKRMNKNLPNGASANQQFAIRNPQWWPQSAIGIVFATMLAVSWRRWTSPIADSGREMDLPLRLLEGEWLYRDVHHIYPPLAPYFNALLYRVFGAHLDVLHVAGIIGSAAIVALCYRIARRLFDPNEASIATIAVVVFCIFKPAGNLIQPYAFAALYGCVCSLGVLLLTLRYAESQRGRELIFAGFLIGLAAITKQEFALAAAATLVGALIYLQISNLKSLILNLLSAALPATLIALPVYSLLFTKIGWQTLVEDCHLFYTYLPASLKFYNSQRTGVDHPWLSLAQVFGAAAVATAALSFVVMLGDRRRKVLKKSAAVLVASFAVIVCIKLIVGNQWDGSPLRALPVLLIGTIAAVLWRIRPGVVSAEIQHPTSNNQYLALLIIAIYSFAILARVALRVPSGGAFGGFFLPTSLLLFCYVFWRILPDAMERWTEDALSVRRTLLFGKAILIVTILAAAVTFGIRYRKNFSVEIRAERGHIFAPKVTGNQIAETLNFINSETQPGESIAVFPEGSDLAFLTGRRITMRHQILIPGLMSERDELQAIRQLQQGRVRYVFIVNRPMREFGLEAFGRDFYTKLGGWIESNYRLKKVIGSTESDDPQIGNARFFVKAYERRE